MELAENVEEKFRREVLRYLRIITILLVVLVVYIFPLGQYSTKQRDRMIAQSDSLLKEAALAKRQNLERTRLLHELNRVK